MASKIVPIVIVIIYAINLTTVASRSVLRVRRDLATQQNAVDPETVFSPDQKSFYILRAKRDAPIKTNEQIAKIDDGDEIMDLAETHVFQPVFRYKSFHERKQLRNY